jgi:hypothetical protein
MAESTTNNNDLDKELDKALIHGLYEENKQLKAELIHYLGELKMLYTRQDSKKFCEEKIQKLKNS